MGNATKYFFKYGDNLLDLVKVNGVVKFTDDAVLKLAEKATKNADDATITKVMLGKYNVPGTLSYIERAGDNHIYFDLGEKWNDIKPLVNGSDDEMWKINKKFIDIQKSKNMEFYFSHDPWNAQTHEFLSREAEYMIDLGATDLKKMGMIYGR